MVAFLIRKFIKNHENIKDPKVREAYGRVTSLIGILINIVLFLFKLLCGVISGSIAIIADAINNLTDAGSSIISLISFKLAGMPADEEHPFGHERVEYVASMIVAFLILFLGLQLITSSVEKIFDPDPVSFSLVSVIVLGGAMLAKFYMYRYNRKYGQLLDSSMMKATAADSLSDVWATGSVLASTLLSSLLRFQLDGYMGVIVAVLIIMTGINLIKDTLDQLLGMAPSDELVKMIADKLHTYEGVLGFHDLIVHNYGPSRQFASVHVEVDSKVDVMVSHDLIDNIERDFMNDCNLSLVIHLDPLVMDEQTIMMKEEVREMVKGIDPSLSIHDFRMVPGTTHTNLIFDVVVPHKFAMTSAQLLKEMETRIHVKHPDFYLVVTFDHAFISERKPV